MWFLQSRTERFGLRSVFDGVRSAYDASSDATSGARGPLVFAFHSHLHVTSGHHLSDRYELWVVFFCFFFKSGFFAYI